MKNILPLLLAATLALFTACSDDDSTGTREEQRLTRAFTTQVPAGAVSGTWNLAGSPYYVAGDVTVPAGSSLTIEAGVDVYMHDRSSLFVEGTLSAMGRLGQPIRFLGYVAEEDFGLWQGIVFRPGSDASHLSYCMVAFGSKFNNTDPEKVAGIVCNDASPTIDHCLIWMNQYNGIALQHGALPKLRSNIIYENDGSGIAFDTSHVGNTTDITGWLSDSLIARNNVSKNSSLAIRYTREFAYTQWLDDAAGDSAAVDLFSLGVDVTGMDENGDDVYRVNENNDRVDVYGNTIQDAMFDEISADFQSFNSCSPCIQSGYEAYDALGLDRSDMGPIVYNEAPNEIRKRLKTPVMGSATYTVTCDAFSHDAVSLTGSTVQFAGYYGLKLDGGATITNAVFEPTADRADLHAAWKSLELDGNRGGTVAIANSTFRLGSESSFSGQDWITAGGMVELRNGAVAEIRNSSFHDATNYGVSAHGPGSMAWVDDCEFRGTGLSAVYVSGGARGRVSGCDIRGCQSYGIFLYNTGYDCQLENNLIAEGALYGVKVQASPAVEIRQNTIVDNSYGGIKLDHNSDPVIRYNLIADNDYALSPIATGIVGTELGLEFDTNSPDINVNWFSGNGGDDQAALPDNWNVGACNDFTQVTLPANWAFTQTIADCENGGVAQAIGSGQTQLSNPGPYLNSVGDLTFQEDEAYELFLGAISFGGDNDFTYSASVDNPNVTLTLTGHHLVITPAANWFNEDPEDGSATTVLLTVGAMNGEGSDGETVELHILAVNDAPIVTPIPTQTLAQGATLTLPIEAVDVEGDPLSYSVELVVLSVVTGDDTGHTLTLSGNTLTLNPEDDFTGQLLVNYTVSDGDELRELRRETRGFFRVNVQ
jgi:parallel beta-helix repeat protein